MIGPGNRSGTSHQMTASSLLRKPYWFREPMVCSADFTTCPAKAEISTDGKTWVPFFETTFIKAKRAAKK